MALSAAIEWDVRTTGSDSNGGGFKKGATGTDRSQQNSAQLTIDNSTVTATITGTTITFTGGYTPSSADVGNVVNIISTTGGTPPTLTRYEITAQSSSTWTIGTASGASGATITSAKMGGSLATIATATGAAVTGNSVHIKSGTYTLTSAVAIGGALTLIISGYNSTHNDYGTKPLITTATNSTQLFTGGTLDVLFFLNLSMSNTASTRGDGFRATSNYPTVFFMDCVLDGFDKGINGDNGSSTNVCQVIYCVNTEIKNCATAAITSFQFQVALHGCNIHDNTQYGVHLLTGNQPLSCVDTVFANNGKYAIIFDSATGNAQITNCVFYNNGLTFSGHPFAAISTGGNAITITNTIMFGGGANYIANGYVLGRCNAMDSAGMGSTTYVTKGDVSLTADPFTNAASNDFSLNSTSGAGAACRLAGFPGVSVLGTGFADIGAIQTTTSGGGGSGAGPFSRIFTGM